MQVVRPKNGGGGQTKTLIHKLQRRCPVRDPISLSAFRLAEKCPLMKSIPELPVRAGPLSGPPTSTAEDKTIFLDQSQAAHEGKRVKKRRDIELECFYICEVLGGGFFSPGPASITCLASGAGARNWAPLRKRRRNPKSGSRAPVSCTRAPAQAHGDVGAAGSTPAHVLGQSVVSKVGVGVA